MFTNREKLLLGGSVLFAVLMVAGSYFGRHWFFGPDVEPVPEHLLTDEPRAARMNPPSRVYVPPAASSISKTTSDTEESLNDDVVSTHDTEQINDAELAALVEALSALEQAEKFFPDGTPVPVHLLCPEEWIGVYTTALLNEDESKFLEVQQQIHTVAQEIVANHNPQRPVVEVWPQFIEAETQLHAQSVDAGESTLSVGGNRIDWVYEQMYNFPEIFEIILSEGQQGRWGNVYDVEMGYLAPDWNLIELPDGREFRVRDGYRYQIGMLEICLSDLATAELIVIDNLDETSDAELERLGGWNYNFNPYTD